MTFLSTRLSRGRVGATGLALALLVAIGIGVHNLGEGLAIGTSFATGELQLGAFLVVGFMVHKVTEGLGIAAPASRAHVTVWQLAGLALIAAAPAIAGTWIGGYASNDVLSPLFFAIAAGAALQVVVEVGRYVARTAPGGLRSGAAMGGFLGRRRDVGDRAAGRLVEPVRLPGEPASPATTARSGGAGPSARRRPLRRGTGLRGGAGVACRQTSWRARPLAFLGPAFVASVAYVDPGNFATNMAGGAKFGYLLLWVILMANLMGMVIQSLSAKLGSRPG